MIKSLLIKNFILIDELTLEFEKGLNIFTGETGAGKSIILKALDIALGAKVNKDVIKRDGGNALIEVTFEKKGGGELVISREISQSGYKNRVDGALVNNDAIKELREKLIDIHSQQATYTYVAPKYHIELLDMFIAKENPLYKGQLEECSALWAEIKSIREKLFKIKETSDTNERQVEFLKFQIEELERAQVEEGEEEKLREEVAVLENAQSIKELCFGAHWALSADEGAICDALSKVGGLISRASSLDTALNETQEAFMAACEEIKACSNSLNRHCERLLDNPQRLDEANERLSLIEKLKRKYGNIFETYQKLSAELEALQGDTVSAGELEEKLSKLEKRAKELAKDISSQRHTSGERLSGLIVSELEKLELSKSRFKIEIKPTELTKNGTDSVEFLISTNVSQDLAPLAKVASGGEISRVMLSIKTVFAKVDKVNTIVFDEIDTGISGKTSQAVANALYKLCENSQVFVITHQPIIASKANVHFEVSKVQGEETLVSVTKLNNEQRLKALAQLAYGDISENSLSFAKDLLNIPT